VGRPASTDVADRPEIVAAYLRFARDAEGRAPLYARIARAVAADRALLDFIAALPPAKRQPNLLLAAVRLLAGTQRTPAAFRDVVLSRADEIRRVVVGHRTQTNEPARCAVLLPLLAALPQPLALLEVGASAGLCLLPDRYAYRYGDVRLGSSPVEIECALRGDVPVPERLPEVAWRAGIDLDPVDVADPEACRWLRALVWPDEPGREERLDAALAIARADPPRVVRGAVVELLEPLAAEAPADATLVVFHTAVLAYLSGDRIERFARAVRRLGAVWISNEAPDVVPDVAAALPAAAAVSLTQPGAFALAQDGRPVAWADSHGRWLHWL
jgi:hypothetical protein